MSRNQVFSEVVYELLSQHGPLLTADLYPLVFDAIPDWCIGDWQHAVENAQQFLKRKGLVDYDNAPGYNRLYIWRVSG